MQALILVGGEGTRLRPLTTGTPKPIITLVDRPFMAFMLQWLASHGVTDVIMACGFKAEKVAAILGDGADYGVSLTFLEEPEPRGTAGALKFAQEHLQERFLMLNGDVLTDLDVSAQLAQHEATGARATLGLVEVKDPSAYGLVLADAEHRVEGFLEKPGPDQLHGLDDFLISAGIYVLERSVLDLIEPDRKVSIETEVWPLLVGDGLYAYASRDTYWADIGTPASYLQATGDILEGNVATAVGERLDGARRFVEGEIGAGAVLEGAILIEAGSEIGAGAQVIGPAVISRGVVVGAGATVERSVLLEDVAIGAGAVVSDSILARRVSLGDGCSVSEQSVLGEGAAVAAGDIMEPGVKLSAGT